MTGSIELRASEFAPGDRWSVSGDHVLHFTSAGNLELWSVSDNRLLWETGTSKAVKLAMQEDGNLVVYAEGDKPLWASNTSGNPGAYLAVQDDGNVVIYSGARKPLWATGTHPSAKHPKPQI